MTGMVRRAKVFWSGRSQAVRLPKEFRIDADEVSIRREGSALVLEPVQKRAWPPAYFASFGPVDESFIVPEPLPRSRRRDRWLKEI